MAAIGPLHTWVVTVLTRLFFLRTDEQVEVWTQNPIRVPNGSRPQPDLALVRRRPAGYAQALPGAGDVLLVIEVIDTSLAYDREVKMLLSARAGIAAAWLVNLQEQVIEVYRDPAAGRYCTLVTHERGPLPAPPALPELAVTVEDVLA